MKGFSFESIKETSTPRFNGYKSNGNSPIMDMKSKSHPGLLILLFCREAKFFPAGCNAADQKSEAPLIALYKSVAA